MRETLSKWKGAAGNRKVLQRHLVSIQTSVSLDTVIAAFPTAFIKGLVARFSQIRDQELDKLTQLNMDVETLNIKTSGKDKK